MASPISKKIHVIQKFEIWTKFLMRRSNNVFFYVVRHVLRLHTIFGFSQNYVGAKIFPGKFFLFIFHFPLLHDVFRRSRSKIFLENCCFISKKYSKIDQNPEKVTFSLCHDKCKNMLSNGGRGVKRRKSKTGNRELFFKPVAFQWASKRLCGSSGTIRLSYFKILCKYAYKLRGFPTRFKDTKQQFSN